MYRPNAAFLSACQEQNVSMDDTLRQALLALSGTIVTEIHQLHYEVNDGAIKPGYELLSGPLDIDALPDEPLVRMLGTLCNAEHGVPDMRPSAYQILSEATVVGGTCETVEAHWSNSVHALKREPPGNPRIQVFTTPDGTPVIARKGRGDYDTGVLLEDVRMSTQRLEMVYPAGSIVQIETTRDAALRAPVPGKYPKLWLPGTESLVSPVSEISGVSFARLSPIICAELAQRRQEFPKHYSHLSLNRPLEQLREMARYVIKRSPVGVADK
jgi:hypothetical protein